METSIAIPSESNYNEILRQAVAVIEEARSHAQLTVMSAANEMHWNIGRLLFERNLEKGYGSGVVKHLSIDLKERYPDMGMSVRNLWDMKRFYIRFKDAPQKLRQAVAVLPWWNINKLITTFGSDDKSIEFYAEQTIAKRWNRDVFVTALVNNLHTLAPNVNKSNNFELTLPDEQKGYAKEVFKDRYYLGFLGGDEAKLELELEKRLVEKIKFFLLELGQGFTYIGNQHVLELGDKEYRVDMLFFHRKLRSLVAIDLKIGDFKPEYIGKMNFYLSLLDRQERGENENPSIGLILCAKKNDVEVELALDGYTKPIGVADFQMAFPKTALQQVIRREIEAFQKEIEGKSSVE